MNPVPITYFSDLLCVWAYIAQLRLDALQRTFGDKIRVEQRFCSVFGDTQAKIAKAWGARHGYESFNTHLLKSAEAFPEIKLNPRIWLDVRPASSMGAHLFVKAAQRLEAAGDGVPGGADRMIWAVRRAFFEEARDIARRGVHREIAQDLGLDVTAIEATIEDGTGFAALAADYQEADLQAVHGSPTFVLNEGRQNLYGNVGYRILEANIQELVTGPRADQASWC